MNKIEPKTIKKWLLNAFSVILILIALTAAYQRLQGNPVPTLFGWGAAVVKTGSMEPAIPTGSLILIQNTGSYEEGDIITYLDKRNIAVTHRIVEINGDVITTQGDANNAKDRPINTGQIIGKVQLTIPGIGRSIVPILISASILLTVALVSGIIINRKEKPQNV